MMFHEQFIDIFSDREDILQLEEEISMVVESADFYNRTVGHAGISKRTLILKIRDVIADFARATEKEQK